LEPMKRNIFSCLASMQMLACRFVLHIHLYIHVHMYKCTYVHMYICTNVHMYKCTHVQMYTCTNVQMYKCIYVHVCVGMYCKKGAFTYIYVHTCICTKSDLKCLTLSGVHGHK
jgi:hypothetical protein